MSEICNFGAYDFPKDGPSADRLNVDDVSTEVDLDFECRRYKEHMTEMSGFDPCFQRKVEALCDQYTVPQLASALHDLSYEEMSARRSLNAALHADADGCPGGQADVSAARCRIEELTIKRVAMESAINRLVETERSETT